MAKTKRKIRRAGRQRGATEDPRAEAITVAWMLCVTATLLAEVAGAAASVALPAVAPEGNPPPALAALPGLMLFSALVTGLLSLLLLALVYRARSVPPPSAVTACSVTVALVPVLIGLCSAIR